MAQFTRVSGDLKPVFHLDANSYTNSGVNAVSSALTVQPQGPKLDFFTITADGALTGTEVNTIMQTVQQISTVMIYEYTDAANDTIALALYPTGAYTAATLKTAVDAVAPAAVTVAASATFTN